METGNKKIKNQESTERKQQKSVVFSVLFLILLCVVCLVFSILCLYETKVAFFAENIAVFIIISALLFTAFCIVGILLLHFKKQTLYKTLISVLIFLLFCFIFLFVFQKTGFFEIVKSEQSLQAYLEEKGAWMPIFYVALQYLQVVILPIPSIVSTLAGVALFGAFKTIVYSLIGIILGSWTAFYIGRKLGNKAVEWMIGKDTLKKWQSRLKGKDNFLLTFMFLLPVFPDDVLCFIAGLSSMRVLYFIIMISISRILSVSATCYSMQILPFNTWWGFACWCGIFLALVFLFVFAYKKMDKIQKFLSKRFKIFKKKEKK